MNAFGKVLTIWTCLTFASVDSFAQATSKKEPSSERIQLVPELTYRQGYLHLRKQSPYYLKEYKDFSDQLYLSLKMVKTFNFINEVVLEPTIRTVRERPGAIETVIDQGYVHAYFGSFNLTAGKKVEYDGSGYFVNPSDLLNDQKDLYDDLYQREGAYLTRLAWSMSGFNLGIGYLPLQKVGRSAQNQEGKNGSSHQGRAWLQMSAVMAEVDLRMQYTFNEVQRSTVGLSLSRFFGDHVELHVDSRYQQRQRPASEQVERTIFDCDVINLNEGQRERNAQHNVECLEPTVKVDDPSVYSVFGTRLVLTPKRTIILEGIQNQGGLSSSELEMYNRYLMTKPDGGPQKDPPTRIYGRQYWFAAYQDEDSIKRTLFNIGVLYNQNDQSAFGNTELRYTINPAINVSLIHRQFVGNKETEFGDYPFAEATYLIMRGKF